MADLSKANTNDLKAILAEVESQPVDLPYNKRMAARLRDELARRR